MRILFSIPGWLNPWIANPQMQNSQIKRANCSYWKKICTYWTHEVQTHVVQDSTNWVIFSIKSPMIRTTDLLSPLGWGSDHSGHSFIHLCLHWLNKDDTLADSSDMNENITFCLECGTGTSQQAALLSKAIPFCRIAFLIRDISVFSKDRLCQLLFQSHWVNRVRASVSYNVLQVNGGNKDGGQMILSVENRACPPGLEEREVDSCKNLTGLYIP